MKSAVESTDHDGVGAAGARYLLWWLILVLGSDFLIRALLALRDGIPMSVANGYGGAQFEIYLELFLILGVVGALLGVVHVRIGRAWFRRCLEFGDIRLSLALALVDLGGAAAFDTVLSVLFGGRDILRHPNVVAPMPLAFMIAIVVAGSLSAGPVMRGWLSGGERAMVTARRLALGLGTLLLFGLVCVHPNYLNYNWHAIDGREDGDREYLLDIRDDGGGSLHIYPVNRSRPSSSDPGRTFQEMSMRYNLRWSELPGGDIELRGRRLSNQVNQWSVTEREQGPEVVLGRAWLSPDRYRLELRLDKGDTGNGRTLWLYRIIMR